MTTHNCTSSLALLLEYLDGLSERAPVAALQQKLEELRIERSDVEEFVRFDENRYLRNLIAEGPMYHVLALCWRSGQRSPVHNHAGSTCGAVVLEGIATETIFEKSPCGQVKPISSNDLHTDGVTASQDADIHQISNLQLAGQDLVTLHVYSPPLLRMDTYSLVDGHVGEFRPMILEHTQGSGI
jgi:cysteine dioxygenase